MKNLEAKFKQISVETVWTVPGPNRDEPTTPCGCHFMDLFASLIRKNGHMTTRDIATRMGIPVTTVIPTVQSLTGQRSNEWIDEFVMRDARWLLTHTFLEVNDVAILCGYPDGNCFSRPFVRLHGITPTVYRMQNRRVRKFTTIKVVGEEGK